MDHQQYTVSYSLIARARARMIIVGRFKLTVHSRLKTSTNLMPYLGSFCRRSHVMHQWDFITVNVLEASMKAASC